MIVAALIAGFVFGFDDKSQVFEFTAWFMNFLWFSFLSLIALLILISTQKYFSRKYGAVVNYELWTTKRFGFWEAMHFKKPFPTGIILPILVALFSTGQILFSAALSFFTKIVPAYRIGKKYTQLTEYEIAKISLFGLLANVLFAVILSVIGKEMFHDLILVNLFIAISYMIPLPGLLGSSIFFGSRNLYVFGLAFILICAILLNFINGILALIIAGVFAIIALTVFFNYTQVKPSK